MSKSGSASPRHPEYMTRMANQLEQYEGLPFLLTFAEQRSMHVNSRAKDLVPGAPRDNQTHYQLEIDPHSPNSELFPIRLKLTAAPNPNIPLGDGWTKGLDGTFRKEIQQEMPSADLMTFRCNRITLFTRNEVLPDVLTVRREVEKIDETHEKLKIFFKTSLPRVGYGFEVMNERGKIDLKSVHPDSGVVYLRESGVRFASLNGTPGAEDGDLAQGVTIEAVIELKPGKKPFYPYVYVLADAEGGKDGIPIQPRTATHEIHGCFEGINYQLSSPRQFKLRSAKTEDSWNFKLKEIPLEAN
jgi:hypothetical protein